MEATIDVLFQRLNDATERSDIVSARRIPADPQWRNGTLRNNSAYGQDPLSHIRTIYLLVTAQSDLIDVSKAEILLSYLRRKPLNVSHCTLSFCAAADGIDPQSDEQASNEVILKIYRMCIPAMPRVASSFALKLSDQLIPMISAPTGGFPVRRNTTIARIANLY